jgi:hypothetical protein
MTFTLDDVDVDAINSRLRVGRERPDPVRIPENAPFHSKGVDIYGQGFVIEPPEAERLIARRPRNAERIQSYLGGDEVNTHPQQLHTRFVINFSGMTLAEASNWPDLLAIVRDQVKSERDALKDTPVNRRLKERWWQYWAERPDFFRLAAPLRRLLVCANVSKHLCFTFLPKTCVPSKQLFLFAFEDYAHFALLQSRVHERWARLLSSSLEDRLRYAASDCFENFPFPRAAAVGPNSPLESIGKDLYDFRARLMVERNHGLTVLYNQLKDSQVQDPEIVALRRLHEDIDRAVLAAYGWSAIDVPPYTEPTTAEEKRAFTAFEDAVIDRLFALNAERAAEEAAAAPPDPPKGKRGRKQS